MSGRFRVLPRHRSGRIRDDKSALGNLPLVPSPHPLDVTATTFCGALCRANSHAWSQFGRLNAFRRPATNCFFNKRRPAYTTWRFWQLNRLLRPHLNDFFSWRYLDRIYVIVTICAVCAFPMPNCTAPDGVLAYDQTGLPRIIGRSTICTNAIYNDAGCQSDKSRPIWHTSCMDGLSREQKKSRTSPFFAILCTMKARRHDLCVEE